MLHTMYRYYYMGSVYHFRQPRQFVKKKGDKTTYNTEYDTILLSLIYMLRLFDCDVFASQGMLTDNRTVQTVL